MDVDTTVAQGSAEGAEAQTGQNTSNFNKKRPPLIGQDSTPARQAIHVAQRRVRTRREQEQRQSYNSAGVSEVTLLHSAA